MLNNMNPNSINGVSRGNSMTTPAQLNDVIEFPALLAVKAHQVFDYLMAQQC